MIRFGRTANRLFNTTGTRNRLSKSHQLILDKLEERTVPAIYTVMNANDGGTDSLRDILSGGKGALVGGDVINFDTTFFATAQTITLTTQLPAISVPITIQPTGAAVGHVTIAGAGTASATNRIFQISGGNGTFISGLTLTGGNITGSGGAVTIGAATVTLDAVTITANKASASGGAIQLSASGGNLTIQNSTIANNTATTSGGAIFAASSTSTSITVTNSTLSGNTSNGSGGVIFGSATMKLNTTGSTFSSNSSGSSGGAINIGTSNASTLATTTLTGNRSSSTGGTIFLSSGTITLNDSTIANSTAGSSGGAIYASSSPTVALNTSSITGGSSSGTGGGAIYMNSGGLLSISRSTIANNKTSGVGGAFQSWSSSISLTNSTLANNSAGGNGGAIRHGSTVSSFIIRDATIVNNTSGGISGGIYMSSTSGTVTFDNSILAANVGATSRDLYTSSARLSNNPFNNSIIGAFDKSNFTITGSNIGNLTGTEASPFDAKLFPLASSGGPTQSVGLKYTSPALNVGNNASGASVDQRGNTRVQGGTADIGAVEGFDPYPFLDSSSLPAPVGGSTTYGFSVTYDDETGVSAASLNGSELAIVQGSTTITPTLTGTSTSGTKVTGNYTFTLPGGGVWNAFTGTWSITLLANKISDIDGTTHKNIAAEAVGSVSPVGPFTITVDEASDVVDSDKTAGKVSFREALQAANAAVGVDTIVFGGAAFSTHQVIDISTAGQFTISEGVTITGPGVGVTFDAKNKASTRHFNVSIPSVVGVVSLTNMKLTGGNHATGSSVYNEDESLTLDGMTLTDNSAGAAIYINGAAGSLTFKNGQVNNTKGGRAIYTNAQASPTVTIDSSSFTGNSVSGNGAVLYTNWGGVVTISNSTLFNNTATGNGSAVYVYGGSSTTTPSPGTITLTNTTVYQNSAGGTGGGAVGSGVGTNVAITINNSTIAKNTATNASGTTAGIYVGAATGASLALNSTIVAENATASTTTTTPDINPAGLTIGGDYNLVRIADGLSFAGGFNKTGVIATPQEADFGKFANYGGPAHLSQLPLLGSSAALDAGKNSLGLSFDARGTGFPRTVDEGSAANVDDGTDIGAFEGFLNIPTATLLSAPNVTSTVPTYQFTVVYNSPAGFNNSTFGPDDLKVTVPGIGDVTPTVASPAGSGNSVTVTYTIPANFTSTNNGSATITMLTGTVTDLAAVSVSPGSLGNFSISLGAVFVVDATNDEATDSDGKTSLREAVAKSNASAGLTDTISFAVGTDGNVITLSLGQISVTDSVVIKGNGADKTLVAGGGTDRLFNVNDSKTGGSFSMSGMKLSGGKTTSTGGAINVQDETVTLDGVWVHGNSSGGTGGGVNFNAAAVFNLFSSTVSGNTANSTGGGGIRMTGYAGTAFTARNSTIHGNVNNSGYGGGFMGNSFGGSVTIQNSTITNNTAGSSGGGAIRITSGTVNVESTVIYGNTSSGTNKEFQGVSTLNYKYSAIGSVGGVTTVNDQGFNLAIGTDPVLAPFGNYGGTMQMRAPNAGSPLLDAGNNTFGLTLDQHGAARTQDIGSIGNVGDGTDIGAYEGLSPIPSAKFTPLGPIVTAGATPNTVDVVYQDDLGMLSSSIGTDDIEIRDKNGTVLTITGFSANPSSGDPASVTVTYTFTVPGGTWDNADNANGPYTVHVMAGKVGDGTNDVPAGQIGSFSVAIPGTFVVNATNDESVDSDGKMSLREAILAANGSASTADTITFDAAVFTTATTITLGGAELSITDAVQINNTTGKSITVSADAKSRVFNIAITGAGNAVSMSNLAITGGKTTGSGAGINMTDDSLTLTNVTVAGNSAGGSGGGVALTSGTFVATGSTLSGNTSNGSGGAIFASSSSTTLVDLTEVTIDSNVAATNGGGVSIGLGTLNITRSTVSRNKANGTTTSGGGGISVGSSTTGTTFNLTNSTVSDNSAPTGTGGGIRVISAPTMTTISSTIASNVAGVNGGGVSFNADNTFGISFQSSIVADNTAPSTADQDFYVPNTNLVLLNGNYNLYGVADSPSAPPQGPNDIYGTTGTPISAKLAPLANYGGPTETRPLGKGSPALDAGFNYSALSTDQRGAGFNRTVDTAAPNANDGTDIGAVEGTTPIPIASLAIALQNVPPAGTPYTFDVVYDDDIGIDTTTIDATDVSVTRPGGALVTGITVTNIAGSGQSVTVTYSFNAPGGSWDITENGAYTVSVNAGAVSDTDSTKHSTGATTLGSFNVAIVGTVTVDSTADGIDFDYSAGKLTLREAVALASLSGGKSTVEFDTVVFASSSTISLTGGEIKVGGPMTISGPGASKVTINGGGKRVFNVDDSSTITYADVAISGLKITGATSSGGSALRIADESVTLDQMVIDGNTGGPAVFIATKGAVVTISKSTISNNNSGSTGGAGIRVDPSSNSAGILNIVDTTLSGNTTTSNGGAIYFNFDGQLNMERSTVSGNRASDGGGMAFWTASAKIVNSTIANNTATSDGGGLSAQFEANLDIYNSTITGNTASSRAGGVFVYSYDGYYYGTYTSTISLNSTIVAGNKATTSADLHTPEVGLVSASGDFNVIGVADAGNVTYTGANNQTGTAGTPLIPAMGPLGNFGGLTQTVPILGSDTVAFNKGSNTLALAKAQNNVDRETPTGLPDVGAFELDVSQPVISATSIPNVPPTTSPYEFTITFTDDVGIKGASVGAGDFEIVGPNGAKYIPTLKTPVGNGSPVVSTWQLTPPGGTWDVLDNGAYTVNLVGVIEDLDGTTHTVATGKVGSFSVSIVGNLVVDSTGDGVDGDYSPGKLTFREALALTAPMNAANTISFDPTVFATAQTITMTGGVYNLVTPVTITGPSAGVTFNAGGTSGIFIVDVPSSSLNPIAMSNLTLANGNSSLGAAMRIMDEDVSLSGVTVTGSTGGPAVLLNATSGSLTAKSSVFSNNNNTQTSFSSNGGGGAINVRQSSNSVVVTIEDSVLTGNTAAIPGGAIYFVWNGTLNVDRTTFSSNSAAGQGGAIAMYEGGGSIKNSTFGNNVSAEEGGAIALMSTASLSIYNSTIGKNTALTGGGLYDGTGVAGFTLDSTIVSQNTGGDLDTADGVAADFSLISNPSGAGTITGGNNQLNVSAGLTALANNGGPTQTFAITNASPAYNAGRNTLALATDQRGSSRKSGGQEDIGAYELQVVVGPPPTASITLDSGTGQRSMIQSITVNFSEAVNLGANPFTVTRLKTSFNPNQAPYVGLDAPVILSVAGSGSTYTITFNDPTYAPLNGSAKSLIDGLYSVSLNASDITSQANGQQLDGNGDLTAGDSQVSNFHRLFGDVRGASTVDLNGNGFTDNVDLIAFRSANGSDSTQINYDPALDSNADGFIDNIDLIAFRARLGQIP